MVDTSLSFYDGAFWDGKLYFSNRPYNGLFCADVTTGATEYLGRFPGEPRSAQALHKRVVADAGKLYFFPGYGHAIDVYSLEERSFSSIPVDRKGKEYTAEIVQVGKDVWILPVFSNQEARVLHLATGSVEEEPAFSAFFRAHGFKEDAYLLVRASYHEGKLWFALYDTDCVASWDLAKKEGQMISTGVPHLFALTVLHGQFFLLSNETAEVIRWNPLSGQKDVFHDQESSALEAAGKRPYNRLVDFDGECLLLPAFSTKLRKLEERNACVSVLWDLPMAEDERSCPTCFMGALENGRYYVFPLSSDVLYSMNSKGERQEKRLFWKNAGDRDEVRNEIRAEVDLLCYQDAGERPIFFEDAWHSLSVFLTAVGRSAFDDEKKQPDSCGETYGKKIYDRFCLEEGTIA